MATPNGTTTASDSSTTPNNTPVVVRDPRFQAGRKLVQQGLAQEGAIEIFATLVEEATNKYGESSIESAPPFLKMIAVRMKTQGETRETARTTG